MTLKDCYDALGGSYDEVIGRLRREEMVKKFVIKFLDDTSFDSLCRAMQERDRETAFRAAHTIKGVCQNLSFTKLFRSAEQLADAVRTEWEADAETLFEQVRADYQQTVRAIQAYCSETEA